MALSILSSSMHQPLPKPSHKSPPHKFPPSSFRISTHKPISSSLQIVCAAARQQRSGGGSGPSPPVKPNNKQKKKKPTGPVSKELELDLESLDLFDEEDKQDRGSGKGKGKKGGEVYVPLPLPKPPAGFVVDDQGRVLMVAPHRLATIVDPTNNLPLECLIRRVFSNSKGEDCLLLCPVDTPVQILKSTNIEGWSAVSDDEVESILPTAAYALAKIHMHLVHSGFCYTARGGFCYSEESIFEFKSDDGLDVDGVPTEGVEITCFHLDGAHYMIYTPSDPLLFVAAKDENGQLRIADDDLLDDPAVVSAIDEETEFNALVEEEAALLETMFGER